MQSMDQYPSKEATSTTPSVFYLSPENLHKLNETLHKSNMYNTWYRDPAPMEQCGTDRAEKGPISEGQINQSCTSCWTEFVQKTSIHGLRFAWEEQVGSIKRWLWLLLLLTCAGVMGYQTIDRVLYYYNYPLTVNVHVNFNQSLLFPSVTLCNYNSFRATKAADLDHYRLLEAMYTWGSKVANASFLQRHNASDVTMDDLFLSTAHDKRDFIVEYKEKCGPANFTRVLTDHGVCFTFTPQAGYPLYVSSSGSDSGMKLTLNVEQYEYMPGPHDSGGVKMLLHDNKDFPKVDKLGLAIPTGTHTYVGIQVTTIENLPPPHGTCGSVPSSHYEDTWYTRDNCQLACLTDHMTSTCGCRHHYMPRSQGGPPVCTVQQFYDCFTKHIGQEQRRVHESCTCPVPCSYHIYDPVISFSTISAVATERLLAATSHSTDLEIKYLKALETTHRMETRKFQKFEDLERRTRTHLEGLSYRLLHDVDNVLHSCGDTLRAANERMEAVWNQKRRLYQWQEFNMQRNFMRVRDAMNERTFNFLVLGYQELAALTESRIRLFMNPNTTSADLRQSLYLMVKTSLEAKIDLAHRTLANYSELVKIYSEGTPLFTYSFQGESFKDNSYITPKPLLRHAFTHSDFARYFCPRFGSDIVNFTSALERLKDLVTAAYQNQAVQEDEIHSSIVNFLVRGRDYYHSKSMFNVECMDYPLSVLTKRKEKFDRMWYTYENTIERSIDDATNLQTSLDTTARSVLKTLNNSLTLARRYVTGDDVRKVAIARQLTSQSILVEKAQLEVFLETLRSRSRSIYDNWQQIAEHSTDLWETAIDDEDTYEFYVHKNLTYFLRNVSEVRREVAEEYRNYSGRFDIRDMLGNWDSQFIDSLQTLMEDMQLFLRRTVIGGDFIRENMVQLDIFQRESHYQHITQQVAYDGFALLCDIGGSMGLFMGASLLSVGEVVDLIIRHTFSRCLPRLPS
ncbi:hypothetical protein ACOMHN_009471 [Nucella lapillus]